MLTSPNDRQKLLNSIKEISNSKTRVDAEKDFQRDAVAAICDELGLQKKYVNKLATIYHKQNLNEVQQETEEVLELYEEITNVNS